MSAIQRCPLFRGVRYSEVSAIQRCPLFRGVRYSELSAIQSCPLFRGVRYSEFDKEYFILDSQIVRAMVRKESYGFNTFVAVRIGEIQENTNPRNWYWIEGKNNIADWLTRGKTPSVVFGRMDQTL